VTGDWCEFSGRLNVTEKSKGFDTEGTEVGAQRSRRLFGIGVGGAGDADAVVGEAVVHFRDVDFGHVAGGAVFCGYRAGGAGMVCGVFLT